MPTNAVQFALFVGYTCNQPLEAVVMPPFG